MGGAALKAAGGAEIAAKSFARGAHNAVVATLDEGGGLVFTRYGVDAAAGVVAVGSTDDLTRLVDELGTSILVTVDTLDLHAETFEALLSRRPGSVELCVDGRAPARIYLESRVQRNTLVVRDGTALTFSPDAWAKKELLDQPLMTDLAGRLRVIALVPRTDEVQRQAFRLALGGRVDFVQSDEELLRSTRNASERLVLIVGHVEGNALVLRSADGNVLVRKDIDDIHSAVDSAHSVALVLGCNSACVAAGTGPTTAIDAFAVASYLEHISAASTPYVFFRELAQHVGPLHVDTDVYGRLRAVSAANTHPGDRLATIISSTRVLFAFEPKAPRPVFESILKIPMMMVIVLLTLPTSGWLAIILLGIGPRSAWRRMKEHYAFLMNRGEERIELLSRGEKIGLFIAGPWMMITRACFAIIHWSFNAFLLMLAFIMYPLFRLACPAALARAHEVEVGSKEQMRISFKDGRDIALLGLLLSCALSVGLFFFSSGMGFVTLLVVWILGFILAASALRRYTALILPLAAARGIFPLVPDGLVRLLLHFRIPGVRIWRRSAAIPR